MKRILITLVVVFSTTLIFSQTVKPSGRIILTKGQKITVQSNISLEASLTGMDLTSTSATENALEVKQSDDKYSTVSNTITKLKVDMNMMGQATSYDSEKKEVPGTDIEKAFAEKLNKPVNIIIDNTGTPEAEKQKEKKDEAGDAAPVDGMLNMFADNSDAAVVSGAFELIPQDKKIGDSWTDSTISKEIKTVRTYTLSSITGSEALIQLAAVTNAVNKIELQGMEIEFKSETKTTGEIITDILTGLVKKKTTQANITGSFQLMGQEMPMSAKANSTNIYK
ncbi:MAG TPA: DUF6263 family protein [Ferruginibacter sp.]|nr:DUF6263 family protein [Ferruginibacter sp.]